MSEDLRNVICFPRKKLCVPKLGPVTRRSRLEKMRDETRRDRLDTVSKKIFCLEEKKTKNINIWVKILGEILRLMYLVSHLVSWVLVSRQIGRDRLVSCLVSWPAVSISSRLVTFVSLPALPKVQFGPPAVRYNASIVRIFRQFSRKATPTSLK